MLSGSAALSDGTSGTVVNLASSLDDLSKGRSSLGPITAASVRDRVWVLRKGGSFVSVCNALTGEIIQKVDILDPGLAIATVPLAAEDAFRVWISTTVGKMYIFSEDGSLIGLLQSPSLPLALRIYSMPLEAGNILFTSSPGKDVALWDTTKFVVERSFIGKTPGEVTTDLVALDAECSLFAVSTTHTIRLWARENGALMCELSDVGASCLHADFSFPPRLYRAPKGHHVSGEGEGTLGGYLWAAHKSAVTVYAVVAHKSSSLAPTISLIKERVLPCPNACQLLRTTPQHVTAVDAEGMVSVWSVLDFGPVRTFTTDTFITNRTIRESPVDKNNNSNTLPGGFSIIPTTIRATRLCWTFGPEEKALLWSDESPISTGIQTTDVLSIENRRTPSPSLKEARGRNRTGSSRGDEEGPSSEKKGPSKDMEKEEITFLRRKLKYMETMATLYRQKVGVLFREKSAPMLHQRVGGEGMRVVDTFNEIDNAYAEALARYEQQTLEQEPLPNYLAGGETLGEGGPRDGSPAEDYVDYWRRKYQEACSDLQHVKDEYESMIELFFLSGSSQNGEGPFADGGRAAGDVALRSPKGGVLSVAAVGSNLQSEADIKRAHHVCQLIKEKNAVRERERQLLEDVARLRAKLREFNSPLASRGPLEDAATLKQQNTVLRDEVKSLRDALDDATSQAQQLQSQAKQAALLKGRMSKMQAAVDEAETRLSTRTAELQADIDGVLDKFYASQRIIEKQKATVKAAQNAKQEAELHALRHQQTIETLQSKIEELEKKNTRQKEADTEVISQLKDEIRQLCDTIGDREAKLIEWQNKYEDAAAKLRDAEMEASSLQFMAERKDTEMSVLMERIAHLESVILERRAYSQTIAEVQGRMELIIEELRHAFTPSEFAASMAKLEDRMANLISVEDQLRQKDDIIAMRDDDIRVLREAATQLEAHVSRISSVFLQLPQSVQEVEALLVEVDEYRRRLGADTNVQSVVRQRILDLQAKRNAKEEISNIDMDLLLKTGMGYNERYTRQPDAEALEKAKALSETLRSVAVGVSRGVSTGLIGAKPAVPLTAIPVHTIRSAPRPEGHDSDVEEHYAGRASASEAASLHEAEEAPAQLTERQMRSSAFSNSVNRPGSAARPGTGALNSFDTAPPSLIVQFDDQFFKDRFRINNVQKDALARMSEAIKASPMAKAEYELYINNFKAGTMRSTGTADDDGRVAIRMHHFSKYIQYVAKYEELNNSSPLRAKLPPTVRPGLRKNFFALNDSERSRFLHALSEFKKSHKWRWIVGLSTGNFTVDESVAGGNKQLRDTIRQANTVLIEKAQLHFKEFCHHRDQPPSFDEHGFVRPVNDVNAGTYCNDSSFALWNRCLVAEFETILRSFDPEPSNEEPLSLPYWGWEEWLNPPQQTEPHVYVDENGETVQEEAPPQRTNFGGLPTAFTAPIVEITVYGRKQLIPNPLLDGPRRAPTGGSTGEKTNRYTVFVDAFMEAQKTLTDQYFQNILRNGDFASATSSVALPAAKAVTLPGQVLRPNGPSVVTAPAATTASFEVATYYIQNLVGGEHATTVTFTPPSSDGQGQGQPITVFSATSGDLATFDQCAWDPLFWLIRANTDRLFCSWQRIHFRSSDAAAAIPKTVNVNGSTRLFPFARIEDLEKQRVWDLCPSESNAQTSGREMQIKKHTATMENWWSVVSLERYYSYDEYIELQHPADLAAKDSRLKCLLVQAPSQQQTIAGDHNNTELEVTIGNLPHSGQLFAFYQGPNGLRQLGSVSLLASKEGTSVVARFDVLPLLTGPTENPKRSMPPRDMNSEPYWIQDRLVLELRTANRKTILSAAEHKVQALFDFARFV